MMNELETKATDDFICVEKNVSLLRFHPYHVTLFASSIGIAGAMRATPKLLNEPATSAV
jgi:hypothetical protein